MGVGGRLGVGGARREACVDECVCGGGAGVAVKGLNKNSDNYIRGCCLFYFYHK